MRFRNALTVSTVLVTLSLPRAADAVESMRIATGLARPIFLTSPPGDPRLFVVGQDGIVTVHEASGALIGTFINLDALISSTGERGLHSIAFPPDYATSQIFYASFTNNSGDTHVSRFQLIDENTGDPTTEELLLFIDQPNSNHNGGRMLFGDDGMLYFASGDGGGANDTNNNAQNLNVLLGKLIRIDVSGGVGTTYSVPSDNPFVGQAGLDEIWAYGLRNPWGFAMDPATHDFYIADVGQELWEEVSVQPASSAGGENYGWRRMEGKNCFNPATNCNDGTLTLPVHEYSSGPGTVECSVTGGYVYRGPIAEIDGHYFFADWCSEKIWSFRWDGTDGIVDHTVRTAELVPPAGTIDEIGGFGQDSAGNVYLLDRGNSTNDGELFKIVDSSVVVDGPSPAVPMISLATPNPFKTSTRFTIETGDRDDVAVTIVDLSGRLVRRVATGSGTFEWDARDENGREVAPGTSLVHVLAGDQKATRRVTFVR
jgi:hypothetical protein